MNLGDLGSRHEEHTVVIAEHHVVASDRPITNLRGLQRAGVAGVETLRPDWLRSQAEDGQPDSSYLGRIAM
jgi:hypothetical protein